MFCRRTVSLAAAALFVLPLPALAQTFEGIITQRSLDLEEEALYDLIYAESADEPEFDDEADWLRYVAAKVFDVPIGDLPGGDAPAFTVHIRGTMLRFDDGSGAGYMVSDLSTMTTRIVDLSTRSYIEYSVEDADRAAADIMSSMGIDPEDYEDYEMEEDYEDDMGGVRFAPMTRALGLTETVNGFSASAYEAEAGSAIGRGWCTEDPSGIRAALERIADQATSSEEDDEGMFGSEGPALEDLICEEGLPVRTKILTLGDWGGLAYSITEILSVERTPVSDDVFAVPAGFTKKSMSEMWR